MKKPHPKEYGFADASEVQIAIEREERRKKKVARFGRLSFWAACVLTVVAMTRIYMFLPQFSLANPRSLTILLITVPIGISTGFLIRFAALVLSERILPSSQESSKANQYVCANRAWRQYIQQVYGYDA